MSMGSSSKKLLVLILDAFSNRYLKHATYLNKLCYDNYCTTIEPLFAYEGIRTAILTGLDVRESGVWHDKVFVPQGRKEFRVKFLKIFTAIVDRMSLNDFTNKALRYVLFKIFREEYGTPHLIPSQYLEYFKTYKHIHKKTPDIFQVLNEKEIRVVWIEPKLTMMEEVKLRKLPKYFKQYDLVILKLNSLDRLGHTYGPLSREVRARLEYLDAEIERSFRVLRKEYKGLFYIVMSDHGMTPVEKTIDIEKILSREVSAKPLKDYVYYIGSTFTSFWFFNNSAREEVMSILQKLRSYGRILSDEELTMLGISKELYGHLIFALNEGIVFFPNFFQRRNIPKGMHGYFNSQYDKPISITNIDIKHQIVCVSGLKFSEVNKVILKFFGIAT